MNSRMTCCVTKGRKQLKELHERPNCPKFQSYSDVKSRKNKGVSKMLFEKIDRNTWDRKEYFEHYLTNVPCTYSMTVKLNITRIRERKIKVYPAMLFYLTTIVNRHCEFRTSFNENNELGIYSEMIPCYTVFHKDTETFSNLWTVTA